MLMTMEIWIQPAYFLQDYHWIYYRLDRISLNQCNIDKSFRGINVVMMYLVMMSTHVYGFILK